MKIIFFGNTKHSLVGTRIIHKQLGLACIVTIPDRPDKRGRLQPSPIKSFALEKNIPFIETDKLTAEKIEEIKNFNPDFFVVEDYGLILPEKLLTIPAIASLNIHHSLLPKYRGTSPAPTAILNGDEVTGVTVIKMTKDVDAGDVMAKEKYIMQGNETTDSLLDILNESGAKLLVEVINNFKTTDGKKQNEQEASFTKQMKKEDGYFDSANPPDVEKLDRMIRAYYPWPNVWTQLNINGTKKIVKLLPEQKLQVEGKKPMSLKDFINGYPELRETIKKFY